MVGFLASLSLILLFLSLKGVAATSTPFQTLIQDGFISLPRVLQRANLQPSEVFSLVKRIVDDEIASCSMCDEITSLDIENKCFGCDSTMFTTHKTKSFVRARRLRGLEKIIRSPKLGKLVANAMNATRLRLYQASAFIKRGGDGPSVFHQDSSAAPFDSDKIATLWIALSDIPSSCGLLKFVKGSHLPRVNGSARDVKPVSSRLLSANFNVSDAEVAAITNCEIVYPSSEGMRAGSATLHLGWTIHGANSNQCVQERAGLAITYFVEGARIHRDLLRVEDEFGRDDTGRGAQREEGDDRAVKLALPGGKSMLFVRLLSDDAVTWIPWLKRKPTSAFIPGSIVKDDELTPLVFDDQSFNAKRNVEL
jgi:hypothetical protein